MFDVCCVLYIEYERKVSSFGGSQNGMVFNVIDLMRYLSFWVQKAFVRISDLAQCLTLW